MSGPVDGHLRLRGAPAGWYALAFSAELAPGAVLRRRLLNQELVVFRTAAGVPVVMGAYCPHLGAHLAEGGRVVGETLRCPFHDLGFAPDGRCVHSPTGGARLPKLRTRTWPVREQHGVILTFTGDGPAWALPPDAPAPTWSAPAARSWRIRTHPQEIIENTVDVGHFAVVHGYDRVEVTAAMQADGPHLTMGYAVTRAFPLGRVRLALDIHAVGVGYSRVLVRGLPLAVRTIVMPTPIDDETTEVRVVTQVAQGRLPRWLAAGIGQLAAAAMGRDFAADIRIWEHKRYQDPPGLIAGDGPIGPYRTWARQLDRSAAAHPTPQPTLNVVGDS